MTRENFFKPTEDVRDAYQYKACGLDNIYLLNGYEVEEHDGESHVFVRNMEELHEAIGRHIVLRRKGLTGTEIRFLRNTLNLTQKELASELGNNAQSIARWEKGQVDIPGDAEKLFRVFFFAKLAAADELLELRDLIQRKLADLDEIDHGEKFPAKYILDGHRTENAPQLHQRWARDCVKCWVALFWLPIPPSLTPPTSPPTHPTAQNSRSRSARRRCPRARRSA